MPQTIFIMGGVHCGSTLLATILGANSNSYVIPLETKVYIPEHEKINTRFFVEKINNLNYDFVVEKSPEHVFKIKELRKDFPNSKILFTLRNSIDVVASLYKEYKNFEESLKKCIKFLDACIAGLNNDNIFVVQYENIVENFDESIQDVCNFTGMNFEKRMKNFYKYSPQWFELNVKENNIFLTRRAEQMKQPLFDGRGQWRELLSEEQINQIKIQCSEKYEILSGRVLQ